MKLQMSENKVNEDIIKSLASTLEMPEEEVRELLEKSDEDDIQKSDEEEETEGKKSDDEEEEAQKSEVDDLKKSIADNMKRLAELTPKKEEIQKSEDDDIQKAIGGFSDKLEKAISEMKDTFGESIETLKSEVGELKKSVDLFGDQSQGTKGVRFNSFLEKSGDSQPIVKGDKTYLHKEDRESVSNAMLDSFEKSQDGDFQNAMRADLINFQGSGELSVRAVQNLNKSGYFFREQMTEE